MVVRQAPKKQPGPRKISPKSLSRIIWFSSPAQDSVKYLNLRNWNLNSQTDTPENRKYKYALS